MLSREIVMMNDLVERIVIREAGDEDVPQIAALYNHYILTTRATFEECALADIDVAARVRKVREAGLPWLVADHDGIRGYAYARPWHEREAYRFTVETAIYVEPDSCSKGIGQRLYGELLSGLQARGLRSALAGIALPNSASEGMHLRFDFEKVAHLKEVGFKFGEWIDVVYYQKRLAPP